MVKRKGGDKMAKKKFGGIFWSLVPTEIGFKVI